MNYKYCATSELPFFKEERTAHQTELFLNDVPLRGVVRYQFEPRKGHHGILTVKLRVQRPMGTGTQEPEPVQRHNLRIEQDENGGYVDQRQYIFKVDDVEDYVAIKRMHENEKMSIRQGRV